MISPLLPLFFFCHFRCLPEHHISSTLLTHSQKNNRDCDRVVVNVVLNDQYFSYIMTRTSYII